MPEDDFFSALDDVVAAIASPGTFQGTNGTARVSFLHGRIALLFSTQVLEYPVAEYKAATAKLAEWRKQVANGMYNMPKRDK